MQCEHGVEMDEDYVPGQVHSHVVTDDEGQAHVVQYVDAEFVGGPLDGRRQMVPLDADGPAQSLQVRFVAPRPPLPEEVHTVVVPYTLTGEHDGHPIYSF